MYLEITTPIQISPLQFCLICDKSYVSDLITTLQMVGLVLGATISGQIADIYGETMCVCQLKLTYPIHIKFILFGFPDDFS